MFKKIILGALVAAACVFAAAPVTTSGVNYDNYRVVATIAKDTITATELDTMLSGIRHVAGEELVFVRSAITGGGSDSVALQIICQATTGLGALIYTEYVDTVVTAGIAGEAVALPRMGGEEMRLLIQGYGANGGIVILNGMQILARKVLTITKPWDAQ